MIGVEVEESDWRELQRDLEALKPQNLTQRHLLNFGKDVVDVVQPYPPVPAGSRYVRTGLLGRSWLYGLYGPNGVRIVNHAVYAGFVQGDEDQTDKHRQTGWKRLGEEAEKLLDGLIEKIGRQVDRIWEDR